MNRGISPKTMERLRVAARSMPPLSSREVREALARKVPEATSLELDAAVYNLGFADDGRAAPCRN